MSEIEEMRPKVVYLPVEDKEAEMLAKFKVITGGDVDTFVENLRNGKYDVLREQYRRKKEGEASI